MCPLFLFRKNLLYYVSFFHFFLFIEHKGRIFLLHSMAQWKSLSKKYKKSWLNLISTTGSSLHLRITKILSVSSCRKKSRLYNISIRHLGSCGGLLGIELLKWQTCLEGCGPRPFLLEPEGAYSSSQNWRSLYSSQN